MPGPTREEWGWLLLFTALLGTGAMLLGATLRLLVFGYGAL